MAQVIKRRNIECKVIELIHDIKSCRWSNDVAFDVDIPLTGSAINLSGAQMAYLFFAVQEQFGIILGEVDVRNYGFLCVRGIVDCVILHLNAVKDYHIALKA